VFCGEFSIQSSLGVPVTLTATEDNTLYEENGNFSNGRGEHIYVGTAQASNWTRRALIGFDLTNSGIPSGATINSVTLRLLMDRVGSSFSLPTQETLSLHRMTADWGEGASDAETGTGPNVSGGRGIAAQAGDATWQFRVVPGVAWGTTGGDFVAAASASRQVPRTIPAAITWSSDVLPDDTLVSDVQGWLDNPATNFGWILRGDESTARSATRFASRSHPTAANRPMLTIDYTVPATRIAGDVDNDRDVDLNDLRLMTASLGLNMGATQNDGDFTGAGGQPDGRVGIRDLLLLRNNLGQTSPSPLEAVVPEPATGAAGLVVVAAVFTGLARRRRRLTG
jgi:hypothetical protein